MRGPALQDLLSGSMQLMFDNLPNAMPMIQDKRLRPLGVTPSRRRCPARPGYRNQHWVRPIRSAEVGKVLEDRGAEMVASSTDEFRRRVVDDHRKWGEVIKRANIKIE